MNLSGILVVVQPARLAEACAALERLPGVEVRHLDATGGRVVVVQESPTVDDEVEGLKRIQSLPHVVFAQLVYHYFGGDAADSPDGIAAAGAPREPSPFRS